MADGVRMAWRLMHDGRFASDAQRDCESDREVANSDLTGRSRLFCATTTIFHPVGTAKTGPESDPMAVLDQHYRVRGVAKLRVVDASLMPSIVRVNTDVTCMMRTCRRVDANPGLAFGSSRRERHSAPLSVLAQERRIWGPPRQSQSTGLLSSLKPILTVTWKVGLPFCTEPRI